MRMAAAVVLALAAAVAVDRLAARRGLDPPGFSDPVRRLVAGLGLAFIFCLGIFLPALSFGREVEIDFETVGVGQLFVSHLLIAAWLAVWCVLGFSPPAAAGYSGAGARGFGRRRGGAWLDQLGLRARDAGLELSVGLAAGLAGWLAVLAAALLLGTLLTELGGERLLGEPAPQIVWLASLPVALRLAVSLAAGVVEELFFRGFLQPRVGVAGSTALFVGAHFAYGEPFMLFGITLLSLFYAWLVAWRRSVWAAMAAHFLFDAVQLLVVIPLALRACG